MEVNERLARANRTAINCHIMVSTLLVAAYLLEVVKGAKSLPYWIILVALGYIPVILEQMCYSSNKAHRHCGCSGKYYLYYFLLWKRRIYGGRDCCIRDSVCAACSNRSDFLLYGTGFFPDGQDGNRPDCK